MADAASASAGGDSGAKEGVSSSPAHQPVSSLPDDVEMEDLAKSQPDPANTETKSTHSHDGENTPISGADRDAEGTKDKSPVEASSSAQHAGPASPEQEDLTIDPVASQPQSGASTVNIMLQLTNGARHPLRIDEKYLTKRNVTVTGKTEDGNMDPASITVYTLKELILRDWRQEWEEPPREPSSIRLIHFGKLLEDRNQLSHYHFSTKSKNWVHMTVKPQDLLDEEEAAKKVKDTSSHAGRSGCCVIL
ncbi:ubiquitin-related domain-containing protein [Astrocystis sublimbata]|nr:ubiquitin-related domain-containing protein [Astrocystis sublimbata]